MRHLALLTHVFALAIIVGQSSAQGFSRHQLTNTIQFAYGLAAADFDGDGDIDIATSGSASGTLNWLEHLDADSVNSYPVGNEAGGFRDVCAIDFDHDGDMDIVAAAYDRNEFLAYTNTGGHGAEKFSQAVLLNAQGPFSISKGDINGDGLSDLVTTEYTGNRVRIWIQQNGVLVDSLVNPLIMTEPVDAIFTDFDGDGDQDVLACSYINGMVWLEQVSPLVFTSHALSFGAGASRVAAGDLDRDGDKDIAAALFNSSAMIWWQRTGTGWAQHILSPAMIQARGLALTDIDGDSDLDIVGAAEVTGLVVWWENSGSGTFSQHQLTVANAPQTLICADFDSDGDEDILVADYTMGAIWFYQNMITIPAMVVGNVRGRDHGESLSGATVRIVQTGRTTITDSNGAFQLPTIAGTVTLRASHPCWNSMTSESLNVEQGDVIRSDFDLYHPSMVLPVSSLNFEAYNNMSTSRAFVLHNTGDGILNVSLSSHGIMPAGTWLSVTPDTANVNEGDSLTVTVSVTPDTLNSNSWDFWGEVILKSNSCPDTSRHIAVSVLVLDAPERRASLPQSTSLQPAFPNPFNAETTIQYELAKTGNVRLGLYDITGRLVQTLQNSEQTTGLHSIQVDGKALASGLYFVMLQVGESKFSQKLLLLK